MLEKIEQNCLNCGAPLHRGASRCDYCGTLYNSDNDDTTAFSPLTRHPPKTLNCSVRIDKSALLACPDDAMEYAKKRIAQELAKQIADCMDLCISEDYQSFSKIIKGRVTIVDPQHSDEKEAELRRRLERSILRF